MAEVSLDEWWDEVHGADITSVFRPLAERLDSIAATLWPDQAARRTIMVDLPSGRLHRVDDLDETLRRRGETPTTITLAYTVPEWGVQPVDDISISVDRLPSGEGFAAHFGVTGKEGHEARGCSPQGSPS